MITAAILDCDRRIRAKVESYSCPVSGRMLSTFLHDGLCSSDKVIWGIPRRSLSTHENGSTEYASMINAADINSRFANNSAEQQRLGKLKRLNKALQLVNCYTEWIL